MNVRLHGVSHCAFSHNYHKIPLSMCLCVSLSCCIQGKHKFYTLWLYFTSRHSWCIELVDEVDNGPFFHSRGNKGVTNNINNGIVSFQHKLHVSFFTGVTKPKGAIIRHLLCHDNSGNNYISVLCYSVYISIIIIRSSKWYNYSWTTNLIKDQTQLAA